MKLIATSFVTLVVVSLASANILVNGDFTLEVPNHGTLNGWTGSNKDSAGGWRSTGGNPDGVFHINAAGQADWNPGLAQAVALQVGKRYRVSGDFARGYLVQADNHDFGVEIDGNLWEHNIPQDGWVTFTHWFVATSPTATLSLTSERHWDSDAKVDNMEIVLDPVPEPASLAALVAGLALMARRRRR